MNGDISPITASHGRRQVMDFHSSQIASANVLLRLLGLSMLVVWPVGAAMAQVGACCVTGGGVIQCFEVTQEKCDSFGGVFHGVGTPCAPFFCSSSPTGACCSASGNSCFTSTE